MTVDVTVTIDHNALETSVSRQLRTFLESRCQAVAATAAARAPQGKTGSLSRNIIWRIEGDGMSLTGVVVVNVPYAFYVHEGTPPHPIQATNARVLRFEVPGGAVLYRPRVSHPGTKPNPFLRDAAYDVLAA